jgi:hypothetical protein
MRQAASRCQVVSTARPHAGLRGGFGCGREAALCATNHSSAKSLPNALVQVHPCFDFRKDGHAARCTVIRYIEVHVSLQRRHDTPHAGLGSPIGGACPRNLRRESISTAPLWLPEGHVALPTDRCRQPARLLRSTPEVGAAGASSADRLRDSPCRTAMPSRFTA